jgi:transcription antitermination factor NusG
LQINCNHITPHAEYLMPLLAAEPCYYPNSLFLDENPVELDSRKWFAVYTRSRMEKQLARTLLASEIPFYLPLRETRWKSGGAKRTAFLPLFPGYVFLCGDDNDLGRALESKAVSSFLKVVNPKEFFQSLQQVEQLLGGKVAVRSEEKLVEGKKVQILEGPFSGMVGMVVEQAEGARFYVQVELIGRGVSIELEPWEMLVLDQK